VLERVGFDAALARADAVLTGEGAFDATSLAGKVVGEVVRRAQAARRRVAVIAGSARDVAGVHVVDGGGRRLDPADLTALAARATHEALGLLGS
jgi:glycerate kinase